MGFPSGPPGGNFLRSCETFWRRRAAYKVKGGEEMTGLTPAAAFSRLYEETRRSVLIYLTARCADPADAADLFQETYTEVYRALCRRGPKYVEHGEAFVKKLAKQQLHKHYRRRKVREVVSLDAMETDVAAEFGDMDEKLVTEELLARAHGALEREDAVTRKIFLLHFSLGLTLGETARELGLGESFVKNRLYRTMARLRRELGL